MKFRRLLSLAAAVITLAAALPGAAAAQGSDVIRGRIVDPDSMPVEGARVTVTSVLSQIERQVRTDKAGRFTVIFPGADGHYVVQVSQIGFLVKVFELKRTVDQDILVADARLEKVQLEPVVVSADVRGTVSRGVANQDITSAQQSVNMGGLSPDQIGNTAAMAASIPGVLLIPGANGGPDGFSVLGLDPGDNSITLNGMTFDGGDLPRDAGLSSSLNTSPYDVSRGGFSGGQLSINSSNGSNIIRRGLSLNMVLPALQWTDLRSQALGNERTTLSLSGVSSGPIKLNSSFYNVSYQYDRTTNPFQTLLNTNALGLRSNGVAIDSVTRMLGVLNGLNVPVSLGGSPSRISNDRASFLGNFNLNPVTSTIGSQYGITVRGNWNRNTPIGSGSSSVPAFGGERSTLSGGIQGRHTAYLKIFLSETSVGGNISSNKSDPFVTMPAGQVRVNSTFDDGTNTVSNLNFGGNQNSSASSSQRDANFTNSLSWFSTNNEHRLKLTTELNYSSSSSEQSGNLLGTFRYNSIADLEAGLPASYSRQLTSRRDRSSQMTGAISLGDSWRVNPDLQIQYGLRVDGGSYFNKPAFNPAIEEAFGVDNSFVPRRVYLTPRIGFSKTLGTAQQISLFEGAARGPRAILRGGIAVQQNSPLGNINQVVNNTGLPNAIQSLNCVGPATPFADWDAYLQNPHLAPDACADGSQGTVFSNNSPGVTLFAKDFRTPHSIRSNLSWTGPILDNRFSVTISGTHSLNRHRASQVDLNFDATERFTLDQEGGRPVYVQMSSIVPRTGAIASRDARISQDFSRVTELRSDLRSETMQFQFNLNPRITNPNALIRWSASYTYQDVREQQRGFTSTVGNPQEVYWSRGASTARHQIGYNLSLNLFRFATIGWNGRLNSGRPYTPTISGDVNGDGYSNDRPFIFDPATTADPALAAEMSQLLASTSKDGRACLMKQLGKLAARNSCESPWTMTGGLSINIDPARLRLPNRAQLSFNFQNPLGGADLLINGSQNPKGWGQSTADQVDPTLLYVRGFDPETGAFKYEVNQRFGSPRNNLRQLQVSTGVTAMISMDIGPTREQQNLTRNLRFGRSVEGNKFSEATYRSMGVTGVPNPITTIMRQQDSLQLTAVQADSLATLNRKYTIQLDSIWAVAGKHLADLPDEYDNGDAWQRYLSARRSAVDLLSEIGPKIRGLLTASQLRKLPASIHNAMDPRYLVAIRNGTGVYVGAPTGLAGSGGIGADFALAEMVAAGRASVIVR